LGGALGQPLARKVLVLKCS